MRPNFHQNNLWGIHNIVEHKDGGYTCMRKKWCRCGQLTHNNIKFLKQWDYLLFTQELRQNKT